jgi:hypothetical protein
MNLIIQSPITNEISLMDSIIEEIFTGNIIKITASLGINVTTFETLEIIFRKPDGTIGSWTATIDPDDNTKIFYNTVAEDLDLPGDWILQSHVVDGTTVLHGKLVNVHVLAPLVIVPS